ncbi:splicing factor, proline- and glutamine-rich-like [Choloepus didactylus]|uniref:splicing factor, proline- and glutamine-rich-like n=1 Tax=Choloepus didactylus TaxID=27675 RepID=UPI0018A0443A|nr:splicing factor, proline- and glutamine-rich-like [Choloepus didactylus]
MRRVKARKVLGAGCWVLQVHLRQGQAFPAPKMEGPTWPRHSCEPRGPTAQQGPHMSWASPSPRQHPPPSARNPGDSAGGVLAPTSERPVPGPWFPWVETLPPGATRHADSVFAGWDRRKQLPLCLCLGRDGAGFQAGGGALMTSCLNCSSPEAGCRVRPAALLLLPTPPPPPTPTGTSEPPPPGHSISHAPTSQIQLPAPAPSEPPAPGQSRVEARPGVGAQDANAGQLAAGPGWVQGTLRAEGVTREPHELGKRRSARQGPAWELGGLAIISPAPGGGPPTPEGAGRLWPGELSLVLVDGAALSRNGGLPEGLGAPPPLAPPWATRAHPGR